MNAHQNTIPATAGWQRFPGYRSPILSCRPAVPGLPVANSQLSSGGSRALKGSMFGKVFASMFDGTMRGRPDEILVFVNLISKCTRTGQADFHFRTIADDIGIPEERVRAAIKYLESPDPESRTRDHEGRRLLRLDDFRPWGWYIVNHDKYRDIRNEESRREYDRERKRAARATDKSGQLRTEADMSGHQRTFADATGQLRTTAESPLSSAMSANADADADAEADAEAIKARALTASPEPADQNEYFQPGKVRTATPVPGDEAKLTKDFGCKFPTATEVDFFAQKCGIPESFWRDWLSEMESHVVLRADQPGKRMLDNGGLPVMNWRTFLRGCWVRESGARGSGQRTGNQNRATGRLERYEDPLEGCRDAVKVPDALPHWDADLELPTDEWIHFKGCFQATITDRELYRRLYRAKQSRGEDTTEIFKELEDECRREWKGAFDKYWTQFISRKI